VGGWLSHNDPNAVSDAVAKAMAASDSWDGNLRILTTLSRACGVIDT
jgi:hypothetical protein